MEWYSFTCCEKTVNYISIPLARMINKCFDEGYFPTQLKFSEVKPFLRKEIRKVFRTIVLFSPYPRCLKYLKK